MARNQKEIERDMVNSAVSRGMGSYIGAGSVTRELLGIAAYQVSELQSSAESISRNAKLSQASDASLDSWGLDLRLPRRQAKRAFALQSDLNIRFFTSDGSNFDTLPAGLPEIKIGDRISSADGTKVFSINREPGILTGTNEAFVGARALSPGSKGNTNPYSLTTHSMKDFQSTVLVENRFGIYNGAEKESREDYRSRLMERYVALEACNASALSSVLRGFVGVGKFNIINNYAGAGTTGIVVQPTLGLVSVESVLDGIRGSLSQAPASGASIIVMSPLLKYVSLQTIVRTTEPLNITEKNTLINRIRKNLLQFFNGLSIGQPIGVKDLEERIKNTDPRIKAIGDNPNKINLIQYSVSDGGSSYSTVLGPDDRVIDIAEDELAALAITNAIDIRIV